MSVYDDDENNWMAIYDCKIQMITMIQLFLNIMGSVNLSSWTAQRQIYNMTKAILLMNVGNSIPVFTISDLCNLYNNGSGKL